MRLHGLVVAAHTPFAPDGSLNLMAVEKQAEHFLKNEVSNVLIGGSTGECHSLRCDERRGLAQRRCEVARGTPLAVVVHVGSNSLTAQQLRELRDHLDTLLIPRRRMNPMSSPDPSRSGWYPGA